jgi:hypothetical protein
VGIVPTNSILSLRETVFLIPSAAFLADRIPLAPGNDTVTDLNTSIIDSMSGQRHSLRSADMIAEDGFVDNYPQEYLNSVDVPNLSSP